MKKVDDVGCELQIVVDMDASFHLLFHVYN